MTHTPQPWIYDPEDREIFHGRGFLASLEEHSGGDAQRDADGLLMAMAPVLLAALKMLAPMIGWLGGNGNGVLHCEYCHGADVGTPNKVTHMDTCPVLVVFAAIKQAEGAA